MIKHDNLAGLGDQFDLLKETHAFAMGQIAKKARMTATKASFIRSEPVRWKTWQLLARRLDVVANQLAQKVLGTKSMAFFLDTKTERLRPLALAAPNPKMTCIWETQAEESYGFGFRSILQNGTAMDTAVTEELLTLLFEFSCHMLVISLSYP